MVQSKLWLNSVAIIWFFQIILFLVTAPIIIERVNCEQDDDIMTQLYRQVDNLLDLFSVDSDSKNGSDLLHPWDYFFLDIVPTIFNQRPNNENGTESQFKEYLMKDDSNDDAWRLTSVELIKRSGFDYELYDAVADDGYITTMTRIINPLANKHYLRYPPLILEHGGTIDPTAYILASSIQHHPEKWPRTVDDGPMTSWNRSLAFVLANNGFDVWLAETRGSNDGSNRKIKSTAIRSVLKNRNANKNMTLGENLVQISNADQYWSFSQDDIIAHELKSHIDTVLRITGAYQVGLFTFSLSTPTSLAFFSLREDYAEKIQGFVCMAPIVSGQGVNTLIKFALETGCPMLPDSIGFQTFTELMFTQPIRDLLVFISQNKHFRYSVVKMIVSLLMGPSAKWKTLLDLNLMGHLLRQLSFREAKQLCQQMDTNKLQKYDHGPIMNKLIYNQTEPPVYDLTNLHIKDWIVVSAANDGLSTMAVLEHMLSLVSPKPMATIVAPNFNHLDLIAAVDNDKYVNLPVLAYFESMSHVPGLDDEHNNDQREGDETGSGDETESGDEAESESRHHHHHHHLIRKQRDLDFGQMMPKFPAFDVKNLDMKNFDWKNLVPGATPASGAATSSVASDQGNNSNSNSSSSPSSTATNPLDAGKLIETLKISLQSVLSSISSIDNFFKMFDQSPKGDKTNGANNGLK